MNILGKKFGHALAVDAVEVLLDGGVFSIEDTRDADRREALEWFRSTSEGVSYTDCLVMMVATSSKTKQIFGFDDAFRKNGFVLPDVRKETA